MCGHNPCAESFWSGMGTENTQANKCTRSFHQVINAMMRAEQRSVDSWQGARVAVEVGWNWVVSVSVPEQH